MITVEDLKAFDLQIWLRSGEEAAQRLFVAQSTVSRRNAETQKLFGIKLFRDPLSEWSIKGDTTLLNLERNVHQLYRFRNESENLRLEATFWAGPTLSQPAPEGWENGVWNHFGMNRPLSLLKDRVIDAWIGSYQPDLPEIDDPDFCVIDLCHTPVKLVANQNHPLVGKSNLSQQDLEAFPSLALPDGWFPKTEAILRSQGLWSTEARMKRYQEERWEGRTKDEATLGYATCLGLEVMNDLTPIDYDLNLISGESLVVRRDLAGEDRIQSLLACLKERVARKAAEHEELTPCF